MLSNCERPRPIASRIRGRDSIIRSLRLLLIRVHRFGNRRARLAEDLAWAARMIDALTGVLEIGEKP
jgi:hypothetical protein